MRKVLLVHISSIGCCNTLVTMLYNGDFWLSILFHSRVFSAPTSATGCRSTYHLTLSLVAINNLTLTNRKQAAEFIDAPPVDKSLAGIVGYVDVTVRQNYL